MKSYNILIHMAIEFSGLISISIQLVVLALGGWLIYAARKSSVIVQILVWVLSLGIFMLSTFLLYG